MSKLVTIYGGSGFVGRYIAQRMARQGWRVRVAVRRPNEALFVKPYGAVGQVEPILCNIRDDASVRAAMSGAQAVVNCVGILNAIGKNSFDAVQLDGAARVARIATEEGVQRLVHLSAIGADAQSDCAYSRTKALGENAVIASFPSAVILRPSVIFGAEDGFFNPLGELARFTPVMPAAGAETRFQPVYVNDVAAAAELAVTGQAAPGIYELGGPDIDTMRGLIGRLLDVIQRRRLIIGIPFWALRMKAWGFDMIQKATGGLVPAYISRDQVKGLRCDNVVTGETGTFADLGITPTAMGAILPDYLWRFRPSGQYAAIKDSAKNLKA